MGSGLCLVFHLDPDTRHYPDRDAKKRLNNSSSMPDFIHRSESISMPASMTPSLLNIARPVIANSQLPIGR
jgi:hypothetical protein